jgi:hypothetical protein
VNKKGTTLIEVILYVALFAIVSILIGSHVNSMVKNFSSGSRTSVLQATGRDALAVMIRNIRNTGFKTYLVGTTLTTNASAFNAADNASFTAVEGNPGDQLTTLQANIDQNGIFTGVDNIRYFLDGTNLCMQKNGTTTILSNDVRGLQFQYGVLGADELLISENPITNSHWTTSGCSWGTSAGVVNTTTSTSAIIECQTTFTVTSPCRLLLKYRVEPNSTAPADTLYWKISSGTGTILGSAAFKAVASDNEAIIPLTAVTNGKFSLRFTKIRDGSLKIGFATLRKIDLGAYTWTNMPAAAQKRFVKAIRISIVTRSNQKSNSSENTPIIIANDTIPRSGPYIWRLYQEVVEIPNNGLF